MAISSHELNGAVLTPFNGASNLHAPLQIQKKLYRILDYPSLHPDVSSDAGSIPPPFPQIIGAEADVRTTQGAASSAAVPSTVSEPGAPESYAREVQILVNECRDFLAQIQRGAAPWVVQRLNRLSVIYGPMPNDPADFSFWIAMVSTFFSFLCRRLLGRACTHVHAQSLIETTLKTPTGLADRGNGKGEASAGEIAVASSSAGGALD